MKTNLRNLLVAAALLGAVAVPLRAQSILDCPSCFSANSITVDDTDGAALCWFQGTGHGYVTVAANSILFENPDASTANTHIECDGTIAADGARNGTVDKSNAACNTLQEIVNIVNKPESDWRCVIYAGLATDSVSTASTLLAATDQLADGPNGYLIKWDTSNQKSIQQVLGRQSIWAEAHKLGSSHANSLSGPLANPWAGTRGLIYSVEGVSTYGSETSLLSVYAITGEYKPIYDQTSPPSRVGYVYTESVDTLWGPSAMGASTVPILFGGCDTPATGCDVAWGPHGLPGNADEKLLVRVVNSAAMATATLKVNGLLKSQ